MKLGHCRYIIECLTETTGEVLLLVNDRFKLLQKIRSAKVYAGVCPHAKRSLALRPSKNRVVGWFWFSHRMWKRGLAEVLD